MRRATNRQPRPKAPTKSSVIRQCLAVGMSKHDTARKAKCEVSYVTAVMKRDCATPPPKKKRPPKPPVDWLDEDAISEATARSLGL